MHRLRAERHREWLLLNADLQSATNAAAAAAVNTIPMRDSAVSEVLVQCSQLLVGTSVYNYYKLDQGPVSNNPTPDDHAAVHSSLLYRPYYINSPWDEMDPEIAL